MRIGKIIAVLFCTASTFDAMAQAGSGPVWKNLVSREIEISDTGKSAGTKPTLAELMAKAVREHKIVAYSNLDMSLTTRLAPYEYDGVINQQVDSLEIQDPITNQTTTKIIIHDLPYREIHTYRFLEEWTFDPLNLKTEIKILGIAPVREVYGDDGVLRGVQAMFWLHYDEAQPILDEYNRMHRGHTIADGIFDDYFSGNGPRRKFEGKYVARAGRMIDIRKDLDDTVVHHLKNQGDDKSLYDVLFDSAYNGTFRCYANFQHGFINPIKREDLSERNIVRIDTQVIMDPVTNTETTVPFKMFFGKRDYKLEMVEYWSFDPKAGKTMIKVGGFAPCYNFGNNDNPKIQPLFWMNYDDVKKIIAQYDEYHPKQVFGGYIWDNYFLSDVKPMIIN